MAAYPEELRRLDDIIGRLDRVIDLLTPPPKPPRPPFEFLCRCGECRACVARDDAASEQGAPF